MMDGQHPGVNNYCFIIKATMKYADMHIADSVIFSFLADMYTYQICGAWYNIHLMYGPEGNS